MISKAVIRSQLLEKFIIPTYDSYTIQYGSTSEKSDLTISNEHNIFDYLALGIKCIFQSIYNENNTKIIKISYGEYPPIKQHHLNDRVFAFTALSNLNKECIKIIENYYDLHLPNSLKTLSSTSLLSTVSKSYLNNSNTDLKFDDFSDTITAQKKAFDLLMLSSVEKWTI